MNLNTISYEVHKPQMAKHALLHCINANPSDIPAVWELPEGGISVSCNRIIYGAYLVGQEGGSAQRSANEAKTAAWPHHFSTPLAMIARTQ